MTQNKEKNTVSIYSRDMLPQPTTGSSSSSSRENSINTRGSVHFFLCVSEDQVIWKQMIEIRIVVYLDFTQTSPPIVSVACRM